MRFTSVEIEESVDVKLENAQNGLLLSSEGYDNGTDITKLLTEVKRIRHGVF